MSKVELLRALVNERLISAAEEIFGIVETTIAEYEAAFRSKLVDNKLQAVSVKLATRQEAEVSAVVQLRRRHVSQRLAAAAEEIFGFFEKTVTEYEEEACRSKKEIDRQRKQLQDFEKQQRELNSKDPQQVAVCKEEVPPEQQKRCPSLGQEDPDPPQLSDCKEEVPPEQQERSPGLGQEDPEPSQIKEEQEEHWSSQNDIMKVTVLPVCTEFLHSQDDLLSSRLYQTRGTQSKRGDPPPGTSTEEMETDGEGCGASEPTSDCPENNSDPSDAENEDTGKRFDWRESGEPPLSIRTQILKKQMFGISSKCKKSAEAPHPKSAAASLGSSYCCKLCGKSFSYKGFLINHVQRHETGADLCGVCGQSIEPGTNLMSHLQTHSEETEVCHICGKQFGTITALEKHIGAHTGDMPYKCLICGKGFDHSGHLKTHMRTHTGEKPFVCSVCGKAYTQNGNLMAHMRAHTGEKPYTCSFCGKAFHRNGLLQTHLRIHTGVKPYTCTVCGKGFTDNRNLKRHSMAHTGEQPYSCSLCGKGFKQNQHLKYHMANHTGEKPFKCEICTKGFVLENDLRRHIKTHSEKRPVGKGSAVDKDTPGTES